MPGITRPSPGAADRSPMLALVDSCVPPDQIPQLRHYREEHPEVEIAMRAGTWQAIIREADGVRTVVRWRLRDPLSCPFGQEQATAPGAGLEATQTDGTRCAYAT